MYGTSIRRAIEQRGVSIANASAAMGYKRPDMLYRILRNEADPSLEALQRLADWMNTPIGDLLPNSGGNPVSDEFRDVLAAISGVAGADRDDLIAALAVNARVLANAFRRTPSRPAAEAVAPSVSMKNDKTDVPALPVR
jgi:transcriptional regulator with XRE-family HTH domain